MLFTCLQLPRFALHDLAQAAHPVLSVVTHRQARSLYNWNWLHPHVPAHWPAQADLLRLCHTMGPGEAALLILAGIIYLLWGLHIFKVLMLLNAALVGAFLGALVGQIAQATVAGAMVGAFTAVAVTWPLMKYAVAVMGGVFGAIAGASLWRACPLPPDLLWAGALSGLILFGMMSFLMFNWSIIVFMSFQGAIMLLMGLVGLATKYPEFTAKFGKMLTAQPLLLPTAVFIPMTIGLIFQHTNGKPPMAAAKGGPPKR